MEIRIRPFEPADEDEVIALWRETARATYTFISSVPEHSLEDDRNYFIQVIAKENDLWVAEVEGEIWGYMALQGDFLDRLYVRLDRKGRGVGTALLNYAKQIAPTGLRLYTHQKNQPARIFYERHGFRAVKFGFSPPPENEPDVEYHWQPAPDPG